MNTTSTHASFTGSIPETYDTYLGPLLFESPSADMAKRVSTALGKPARVLEVACGTGISTRHLAGALAPGSELTATDLNQAMLDHAQRVNGDLTGVSYSQADALDLPFDDASFDAVVCQFGIMFFPDKARGMEEMSRVLKPGGVLAINVWDSLDANPAGAISDSVIQSFFETDPPRFIEIPFSMHDVDVVRDLFAAAGFKQVESAHVAHQAEAQNHQDTARGFVVGNPTILEIEKRPSVKADDIIEALAAELEREFGAALTHYPFQKIVFVADKPAE